MTRKNKTKKLKRLSLKTIWFGLMFVLVWILGTAIFTVVVAVNIGNVSEPTVNDLLTATVLTSLVLLALFALVILLTRKSKKTLLRWSKKSFIVLAPLVIVAMAVTVLAINSEGNRTSQQSNSVGGLAGQQGYVEGLSFKSEKLLAGTNDERTKNAKTPLTINAKLNESALRKCEDMVKQNYWSHNDPSGLEPWRFIDEAGYAYDRVGENLAFGFTSEDAIVTGWTNSESHRQNLLDQRFTEVGFATCLSGNFINQGKQLIVVQHFASPRLTASTNVSNTGNASAQTLIYKPFVAGVCTRTTIPYETVYDNVSYMYAGETREFGGWDGYKETCTADSNGYKSADYTSPAYKKTVYMGTKQRSTVTGSGNTPTINISPSPPCVPDGQGGYQC